MSSWANFASAWSLGRPVARSSVGQLRKNWVSQGRNRLRRGVDISVALLLLPALCLFFVLLWLFNPWANPGPVLFRQQRIGKSGRPFVLYKFRSMTGHSTGVACAQEEHQRIPRLGWCLRRTHLDELPQIFNLLNGTMTLVGPRPEQPEFVAVYRSSVPGFDHRHGVLPGITGLAQLRLGYTCDTEGARKKLRWDLFYIAHSCMAFDLYLIWKTVVLLCCGRQGSPRFVRGP